MRSSDNTRTKPSRPQFFAGETVPSFHPGWVALVAVTPVLVMSARLAGSRTLSGFDRQFASALFSNRLVRATHWLEFERMLTKSSLRSIAAFGGRETLGAFLVGVVAVACHRRDRVLAVVGIVGPVSAGAVTEYLGKPLIDRRIDGIHASFPSGHVTSATAIAAVCWILIRRVSVQRSGPPEWRRRLVSVLSWGVWLAPIAVGVAVVRLGWHVGTDVLGGIGVGLGLVFATLWFANRVEARGVRAAD